jgi:hypothetical protein
LEGKLIWKGIILEGISFGSFFGRKLLRKEDRSEENSFGRKTPLEGTFERNFLRKELTLNSLGYTISPRSLS